MHQLIMLAMSRVAPAASALVLGVVLTVGSTTAPLHPGDARHLPPLLVADNSNEGEHEVPVVEGTEPEDSPAADLDRGRTEAQMPSAPSVQNVEQPEVEAPAEPEQPAVEP